MGNWALLCSFEGSSEVGSHQLTLEDSLQSGQATRTALALGSKNSTAQHCVRVRTITVPSEQEHQDSYYDILGKIHTLPISAGKSSQ